MKQQAINFVKQYQTLILVGTIYVLTTVFTAAVITTNKQQKTINFYEQYMDEQEAELQAVVNDNFLLQQTLNEVLEDSRMLQELQHVGK